MTTAFLQLNQLNVPVENIPLAFRCGFVLLLVLVMVLMKDDKKKKVKL